MGSFLSMAQFQEEGRPKEENKHKTQLLQSPHLPLIREGEELGKLASSSKRKYYILVMMFRGQAD